MDNILLYIFITVFGLLIGSFLNVCICRLPESKSVAFPPSHCTACETQLKALDLIPVFSYIFLRGHCRYCGEKISVRYPLIELLTAVVFSLLFYRYGLTLEFAAAVFLTSILLVALFIDAKYGIIPDELTVLGLAGGILLVAYRALFSVQLYGNRYWWDHLLGILPGTGFLFLIAVLGLIVYKTDEAMGMGDVKILAPIGILLGWKLCLLDTLLSIFIGGIVGLFLIVTRSKSRKDTIPFGPFIVISTFVTLMWGSEIIEWYLKFIRLPL